MHWNKFVLPAGQGLGKELAKIRNQVGFYLFAAGKPGGAAVLTRELLDGSVAVYFSPGAAQAARQLVKDYQGFFCNPPTGRKLVLLAGDETALGRQAS